MSKKKTADPVSAPKTAASIPSTVIGADGSAGTTGTNTAVATRPPVDMDIWGMPKLTAQDVVLPKILAMQGMSKLVTDGLAVMGEFRDSLNNVVLGDLKNPIEFIPFHLEKVFVVMEEEKEKYRFHHQEPITPENEKHAFEDKGEKGAKQKWYRTINVYALLPKDVKDGAALPFVISFRSTSANAGRKVATTMYLKNVKAGKTPAAMVLELSGTRRENDKGKFIVMDAVEKRASTEAEVQACFEWVKVVRAGQTQVDHSDLEKEAEATAAAAPESTDY